MFYKKVCFYPLGRDLNEAVLTAVAQSKPAADCTALQLESIGYVPIAKDGPWALTANGCTQIVMQISTRMLPGYAVRDALEKRLDDIERREQRTVRGKEKLRLKEAVVFELLPRTLQKKQRIRVYVDHVEKMLCIEGSTAQAEVFITSLMARLMDIGQPPAGVTHLLNGSASPLGVWADGTLPDGFILGDSIKLKGKGESTAVTYKNDDLDAKDVQERIAQMDVVELALETEDFTFVMDSKGALKQLAFSDLIREERAYCETDSELTRLDADLAIQSAALRRLFISLSREFVDQEERVQNAH